MAKIGYIQQFENYSSFDSDYKWMKDYGCCNIVVEEEEQEKLRPRFRELVSSLHRGDELVISRLSNAVRGSRELSLFLEACRISMVRLISINDKIDTGNELFPETKVSDVLITVASLPAEVVAMRKETAHIVKLKKGEKTFPKGNKSKIEREKSIVTMYCHGQSIDSIWRASGFRSRSSVFRILNKHGITLNRGHHQGPLGRRKKAEEE